LNFPLPNSGELDAEEIKALEGITAWTQVNGKGIYSIRPWKIYARPSTLRKIQTGNFNEDKQQGLTAEKRCCTPRRRRLPTRAPRNLRNAVGIFTEFLPLL